MRKKEGYAVSVLMGNTITPTATLILTAILYA